MIILNKQNIITIFSFRFLLPRGRVIPNLSISLSSFAITISIAILIIVTSVMNGFRAELLDKILGLNSHITIYKKDGKFVDLQKTQKYFNKIKDVKNAIPVVNGSGMIVKNGNSTGVFVKGISAEDIKDNKELLKTLVVDLNKFKKFNIIVGKDIARQLGIHYGDEINIIVPIVSTTMFGTIPRQVKFKVIGIINSNAQQYDSYFTIIPFQTAQVVYNLKDNASAIEIVAKNPQEIDKKKKNILDFKGYYFSDWRLENAPLLNALKVEANVMTLILGLFLIISMFTIFAVVRMMIKSKEREIAILKAQGISNRQICLIFFIVGITISTIGMLFGNLLGIIVAKNIDAIRIFLDNIFGTKLFDGSVYFLNNLPSRLMINDVIKINVFSFILSILCTIISTIKNTKIDITKTLRNN